MRWHTQFSIGWGEEGTQNLKWIKQILSESYFPQLRQLRRVTWSLTSPDLTWRQVWREKIRCQTCTQLVVHWVSVWECGLGEIFARSTWGYSALCWTTVGGRVVERIWLILSRDFALWNWYHLVVRTPLSTVSFLVEVKLWSVVQYNTVSYIFELECVRE